MLHIQYASDLHVDDFPKGTPFASFVSPDAPILILAGDIASVWNPLLGHFLAWCSRNWSLVVFTPGNHDYYDTSGAHRTIEEGDRAIAAIASNLPNVVFLQNGASYVIPHTRIRLVGATLWSAVDPVIWDEVAASKGDFKHLYTNNGRYTRLNHPSDSVARHALHRAQIAAALSPWFSNEILIVITHYMPTWELLEPHYKGERFCTCYASHDDDLFVPQITAWICGHSHRATRLKMPTGPLLVMNARGYNRSYELGRTTDRYSPRAVLRIA